MKKNILNIVASASAMLVCGSPMMAQAQDVLPRLNNPSRVTIGRKAKDSVKDFPRR